MVLKTYFSLQGQPLFELYEKLNPLPRVMENVRIGKGHLAEKTIESHFNKSCPILLAVISVRHSFEVHEESVSIELDFIP